MHFFAVKLTSGVKEGGGGGTGKTKVGSWKHLSTRHTQFITPAD